MTFPITVVFDPKGVVVPAGLSTTLAITTERRENALAVPSRAIKRLGPQTTVDVLTPGGGLESRPVRTGITAGAGQVEIVSGLSDGDRIAVPAIQRTSGNGQTGGDQFVGPIGVPVAGPGGSKPVQIVIGGP